MTWISYRNFIHRSVVTASRELAQLPVNKIKIPGVFERYRAAELSVGDTRTKVDIAFGGADPQGVFVETPQRATVVAWFRPRRRLELEEAEAPAFLGSDLVRHTISSDDQYTGDIYDSGDGPSAMALGKGVTAAILPDGDPYAYASFEFDALSRTQPPANFVDWGYAWYGRIDFEPEIDYVAPAVFGHAEGAVRRFSEDGSAFYIRRKQLRRRWQLRFNFLKWETERAAFDDFLRYAGDGGRFLMGLDRDDLAGSVVLAMLDQASLSRTSRRLFQAPLSVIEAI